MLTEPSQMINGNGPGILPLLRQDLILDTACIRQELGYQERVSLDEALKRTIAWQRANPPSFVDPDLFHYTVEDAVLAQVSGNRDAAS
jgi:hypothetical protein